MAFAFCNNQFGQISEELLKWVRYRGIIGLYFWLLR